MQLKYRLYRRHNGVFYWQENRSRKQGSLKTPDSHEAERLLHAMNESHRVPTLNLNIARAYLAAHDPKIAPSYLGFVWRIGTYLPTLMIPRPFRATVGPGHKPKCQGTCVGENRQWIAGERPSG